MVCWNTANSSFLLLAIFLFILFISIIIIIIFYLYITISQDKFGGAKNRFAPPRKILRGGQMPLLPPLPRALFISINFCCIVINFFVFPQFSLLNAIHIFLSCAFLPVETFCFKSHLSYFFLFCSVIFVLCLLTIFLFVSKIFSF